MPIYIRWNEIKGKVTAEGHGQLESGAGGGVWKTSNFLTAELVAVSRISLAGGSVDAREALPTRKAAELFERAGRTAPGGKLYVATEVGVFQKGALGGNGALENLSGNNTWAGASRPGAGVLRSTDSGRTWNSGRASGPGVYKTTDGGQTWVSTKVPVVELFVTDRGCASGRTFRLRNVTIAPGPRGTIELSYSSIET